MRKPLARHEVIKYKPNEPFRVTNASRAEGDLFYVKNSHWHEELEISYIQQGHYCHYIDGERIEVRPGQLVVTNCESIHRIDLSEMGLNEAKRSSAVVLLVHNHFLEENVPEYKDFWFTNDCRDARPEVRDIMLKFSEYAKCDEHKSNEHLYMRGLLLQLLYYLCEERAVNRTDKAGIRQCEQVMELKEILQFVENHYAEPIIQADVAREFYFTPQYFARYFKRTTGITFTEHLTAYRLRQAGKELTHTDKLIKDIALDNGFADDRCFINAFKKQFGITPHQFRKEHNQQTKR